MQNKINKIKHTGVYVLVVDDYLYKTGDIFGEGIFLPMDSPAISKYDDTYVIIKYDLSDITNQTQKNCIFRKNCASVPEERSAIPLQTEQSSAG